MTGFFNFKMWRVTVSFKFCIHSTLMNFLSRIVSLWQILVELMKVYIKNIDKNTKNDKEQNYTYKLHGFWKLIITILQYRKRENTYTVWTSQAFVLPIY